MTSDINGFAVGAQAFMTWMDGDFVQEIPSNPFPQSSKHYEEWETGFSDAEEYFIHGQYEGTAPDDEEEHAKFGGRT